MLFVMVQILKTIGPGEEHLLRIFYDPLSVKRSGLHTYPAELCELTITWAQ